jgi:hypothetical protein
VEHPQAAMAIEERSSSGVPLPRNPEEHPHFQQSKIARQPRGEYARRRPPMWRRQWHRAAIVRRQARQQARRPEGTRGRRGEPRARPRAAVAEDVGGPTPGGRSTAATVRWVSVQCVSRDGTRPNRGSAACQLSSQNEAKAHW